MRINDAITECFFDIVDVVSVMDYRSFAVSASTLVPPRGACDGIVPLGASFARRALATGKKVTFGVETDCGLGEYTWKVSFCNQSAEDVDVTLHNVSRSMNDIRGTVAEYPCSQDLLPPSMPDDLTDAFDTPAYSVHSLNGLFELSSNYTENFHQLCAPTVDWITCI